MSFNRSVMSICVLLEILCRRKRFDESSISQSSLARVLNTFDLTALGVGSTLGVGIYVLAGEVSKTVAGPAVVISFLLAAITSVFAGLCYAEFGARVPKAGSAYIYSYYCVGELVAFVIGWNLILEYIIGAASVARGISTYIDSLLCNKIRDFFLSFAPLNSPYMSPYVDLFAFGLCLALAAALACGVKESTTINNFLTFCNLSVVVFVIVSGLFKADIHNWQLEVGELPDAEAGNGGFAPFGLLGIIKGAAICFYGFVGFDCIATTGEEVKNPQRAIPVSILVSLLIIFLAYFGVSSVLTLMLPYYLQDPDAPIPHVYEEIGWDAAKWLVSIGALFGLFSSLFGAMFPLPRIIYAMASDGLIFRILGCVNPVTKTPVIGTFFAGLVTATMSALFNLQQLISLMALGTLLAYTIVAISVVILRYSPDFDEDSKDANESTSLVPDGNCRRQVKAFFLNYFSCGLDVPTDLTRKTVVFNIIVFSITSFILSSLIMNVKDSSEVASSGVLAAICIMGTLMLFLVLSMCSQPKSHKCLPFQMPLVPLLPCISIFFNVYLMMVLDGCTWIRFSIWMGIGLVPYSVWYLWRYCCGRLSKNSLYNINRVNTIKLNELVWKLFLDKKTLFAGGCVNEGFVEDGTPAGGVFASVTVSDGEAGQEERDVPVSVQSIDEIRVFDEVEETEESHVVTKVHPWREAEEQEEMELQIVEVHTQKFNVYEAEAEDEAGSMKGSAPIERKDPPDVDGGNPAEGVTVFRCDDGNGDVERGEPATRNDKFSNRELREKLNKILQEQALAIQSGMMRDTAVARETKRRIPQRETHHVDVKTLTKSEIANKLQVLLKNGPPQRPSFRTSRSLADPWRRIGPEAAGKTDAEDA